MPTKKQQCAAAAIARDFKRACYDLQCNSRGLPHGNLHNARQVLTYDPLWRGRVWFDTFHQKLRTAPKGEPERDWADSDDAELTLYIQSEVGIFRMSLDTVRQAVQYVASLDKRSEPARWIHGLRWDGFVRMPALMSRGFGAEDTDYTLAVGRNLILGAVQRVDQPGCKLDTIVIFEGPQGIGKSNAIEALAGPWYGSMHSALGTKDALLEMPGHWFIELAELDALSKRQTEEVKAFASRGTDTYRPPYGRHTITAPRQCVFVGSTNEHLYLNDATGGRRFLPIRCGSIDIDWIKENRDQIFAEAAHQLEQGSTWWQLPIDEATREQEERYAEDPWTDCVARYVSAKDAVTVSNLLVDAVALDLAHQDRRAQMRVAQILRRLGWRSRQEGPNRKRVWRPREDQGRSGHSKVVQLKTPSIQYSEHHEQPEHLNDKGGQ